MLNFQPDTSQLQQSICLEDHRLMIDRAIDKLKGELREKEREQI